MDFFAFKIGRGQLRFRASSSWSASIIVLKCDTLFENSLQLKVTVKNTDNSTFPYILGWHPYFLSDDLSNSFLKFKSPPLNSFSLFMFDSGLKTPL